MKTLLKIIGILILLVLLFSCGTNKSSTKKVIKNDVRGDFRIMFYNCENLFDIFDDSLTRDDDFTPEGGKHWTWKKYQKKIMNISKVITAVGGWEPPAIVGVCEIENRHVLEGIVFFTPLKKHKYQIIHKESPDRRGIDVGLLYLENKFTPIKYEAIQINFPDNPDSKTRDVLYVCGTTKSDDTLHIYINHWPSRWGGQMETEHKRMYLASVVKKHTDSIFNTNPNANIIVMGDLNDFPTDKSLMETLEAQTQFDDYQNNKLYNLAWYLQEEKGKYSHRFHGEGGVLDQIIVSGALLSGKNSIYTTKDNCFVYEADFLLEEDEQYLGKKPFRTYIGFTFHDGFSDHLPVYIDLFFK